MKQLSKLTDIKSAREPKKKVTRKQHKAILRKKNEPDRDTTPRLSISVSINVEDGKLSAIRFSPEAAAKISRAKGFPHYALSREEKKDKLRKLLDYDFSSVIERGSIKQVTYFNPLASCYFPHMWDVRAGGKRTSQELFHDGEKLPWAMGKHNKLRDRSQRELREEKNLPDIFGDYSPPPSSYVVEQAESPSHLFGHSGRKQLQPGCCRCDLPLPAAGRGRHCVRPLMRLGRSIARSHCLR